MTGNTLSLVSVGLLLLFVPELANAADNDTETKLRDALRNTTLQLRTAENERATLQASQAESEAKIKTLTAKLDALTKNANAAERKVTEQQTQLARYKEAVQNWQAAYKQAVDMANTKETNRVKLASEVIILQRHVDDQRTRNAELYRTAREILNRYERFGLGEALAAKEPFVGVTRVKLENLVQDYEDKLTDERIKDSGKEAASPPVSAAGDSSPKAKP